MISIEKRDALLRSAAPMALVSAMLAMTPVAALAQTTGAKDESGQTVNQSASSLAEVVVTARKKSETLLDVPLAITALPAAVLEAKGIETLNDVGDFTPSLTVSNPAGGSYALRSQQTVVIRGMTDPAGRQTTTVFLNGAPLAGAGIVDSLDDVAQVEVVKGPQAAYFGRTTFGGAINIVTKAPSDTYHASLEGLYGSYNWTELKGSVQGPIIPGILDARLAGRYYNIDGQYANQYYPSEPFGAQMSKDISGELSFTPIPGLRARLFGSYSYQNDGQSAFVKLTTPTFNCTTPSGTRFNCGVLPNLQPIGPNTYLTPAFLAALQSPAAGGRYPYLGLNHSGDAAEIKIGTLNISYDLPHNWVLSSVSSANQTYAEDIVDLANEYFPNNDPNRWPFETESAYTSVNQEIRVTSDQSKRLRGSFGANYQWMEIGQANMGQENGFAFQNYAQTTNRDITAGIFGAFAFDITHQLILNFEARYQSDHAQGIDRTIGPGGGSESVHPGLDLTTNEFLPRVILQYKITPRQQVYFTYSQGANPGGFNNILLSYTPALTTYLENLTGAGVSALPERLDNYEVGYKGAMMNGRLQLDADVYYAHWYDQLLTQSFYVNNFALTGKTGAVPVSLTTNAGDTDLYGLEGSIFFKVNEDLSVNAAGSINDSYVNQYADAKSQALLGIAGASPLGIYKGKSLPQYSKYSANFSIDYSHELKPGLTGFAQMDFIYKSGQYGGVANFEETADTEKVNVRVGVDTGKYKITLFVDNLSDNRTYTSIQEQVDIDRGYQTIDYGTLPMPRRFGVKMQASF